MTRKLLSYRVFTSLAILSLFCVGVRAQTAEGGPENTGPCTSYSDGTRQVCFSLDSDLLKRPVSRTADGHPDLAGMWNGAMGITEGSLTHTIAAREGSFVNFERDDTIVRRINQNRPLYKPQYWETVKELDEEGNGSDPRFRGMPAGVPRMGPPIKIIQLPAEMVFLYTGLYQNSDTYRIIPTDGRPHTPDDKLEGTWKGESLGHWEGDTFVVDTVGFNSSSWLCIEGCIHSENMHVIERFTRKGDTIAYDVTVDDPDMLIKPWVEDTTTMVINSNPKAIPDESLPYQENDVSHFVTKEHH